MLEDAATQVRLELVDHELGQAANLLGGLAELRPALSEDEARHREYREMMQAEQLEFEALMDDAVGDESWQETTKGEADDEIPF